MIPTCDPDVFIEEQREDYVRYLNADGRRWEVHGKCIWTDATRMGPCGEGSEDAVYGPPEGRLDVPITPEFTCSLCTEGGYLTFKEL